jgi:hypothetical protein
MFNVFAILHTVAWPTLPICRATALEFEFALSAAMIFARF